MLLPGSHTFRTICPKALPEKRKKLSLKGRLTALTKFLPGSLDGAFDAAKKKAAEIIDAAKLEVKKFEDRVSAQEAKIRETTARLKQKTLELLENKAVLKAAKAGYAAARSAFADATRGVREAKAKVDNVCRLRSCSVRK